MAHFGGDASMPVAVIGMGCRFPGDATSPDRLWELIINGRNAWSELPKDRINIDGFYHPSGDRQGSICFKGGHFLKDDVAAWDAPFFSTTAHEAAAMDPQQRILLEVSYEAFENAGIPMENLPGSATAVYCGSFVKDYEQIVLKDPDDSPQYAATGNGIAIMSNRVSWFYDLKGPSMTLDTGCSASLVGVHLACQSLRAGESSMAIAMGTGLILTPSTMMPMTALNFLSPDGKCFTFDERANGYGRGEGIGAVVLKPLETALRDNDTIRAVIRGSGVNQDGRTPGITMPSKEAQAMNIRAVYNAAGLEYDQTAYFEAHGTGTQAGDPTELGAISETFAETRDSEDPLYVGSVKTNIGHLEGCAGIAGLIKGVLTLEKGLIPPNLYLEKVNPKIDLEAWRIKVPTNVIPWPKHGLRRVSVNCFGFGGTNAHIILDDALHYLAEHSLEGKHSSVDLCASPTPSVVDSGIEVTSEPSGLDSSPRPMPSAPTYKLYVLSSHDEAGIFRLSAAYSAFVKAKCTSELYDEDGCQLGSNLAHTLCRRRSKLPWKSFLVSSSTSKLALQNLEDLSKPVRSSQNPKVAYLFSGQGAQWFAMGRELLQYQRYSRSLEEADAYMRSIGGEWSLMKELLKDQSDSIINAPRISQPLCTALQLALIDLLKHWNVQPYSVVGHSSGEIAAAYALGALSKEDAWKLAFHRGRLTSAMRYLQPNLEGRMMAVALSEEAAKKFIGSLKRGMAVIACINGPENVTISGDESAVLELEEVLTTEGVFARLLKVENAYHSSHMKAIEHHYLKAIKDIRVSEAARGVRMYSSVTGKCISSHDLGPPYWAQNMVSPVRFSEAVNSLLQSKSQRPDIFLELGPHAVLQAPVKQILDAESKPKSRPTYVSMLYRGKSAIATSLEAVGHVWTHGCPANLGLVNKSSQDERPRVLTNLPSYPWDHSKTYWHESHLNRAHRLRKYGRQDLIGNPTVEATFFEPRWRGFIRASESPWVQDHQVQNTIIYPAAGMLAMVLEGARQVQNEAWPVEGYEILNMSIGKAMIVPTSAHGLETSLNMKRHDVEGLPHRRKIEKFDFAIYSKLLDAAWQKNASGLLNIQYKCSDDSLEAEESLSDVCEYREKYTYYQGICDETYPSRQLYETLEAIGMKYGQSFRNITSVQKKDNISCTTVRIPDTQSQMPAKYEYPHLIHPATMDAIFQTLFIAGNVPMVPSYLESLFVSADFPQGAGAELRGYSVASRKGLRDATGNIVMFDEHGNRPKLVVKDLHFTPLANASDDSAERVFLPNHHNLCVELTWKEDVATANPSLLSEWLQMLSHKDPAMQILDTCSGRMDAMFSRLRILGGQSDVSPKFSRYTFVSATDRDFKQYGDASRCWPDYVDFKVLDLTSDISKQGLKAHSYDLVFARATGAIPTEVMRELVSPGGKLIIMSSTPDASSGCEETEDHTDLGHRDDGSHNKDFDKETLFLDNSFHLSLTLKDDMGDECTAARLFVSSSKATNLAPLSSREVLILLPADPSPGLLNLSVKLTEALLLAGAKVSSSILTNPNISFSAKLCLALLEVESSLLFDWTVCEFEAFRSMISGTKGCLWVTKGGQMNSKTPFVASTTALFRTIQSEDPQKALVTLDLDAETNLSSDATGQVLLSTFLRSFDPQERSVEREYAECDGRIFVPRAVLEEKLNSRIEHDGKARVPQPQLLFQSERPLQLEVGIVGKLDSLHFHDDTTSSLPLAARDMEIQVQAVGINDIDVETALGQTSRDTIGSDVAGVITKVGDSVSNFRIGDRVVTIVSGAFKTLARSHESIVQRIPDHMSFEVAASLPTDMLTVYYATVAMGRLKEGESVLIHGGSGGLIQAAIQITQKLGAELFVSVRAGVSRNVLAETWRLPVENVLKVSAHSGGIGGLNKGKGFDLILNSYTGEIRSQALACIREYGRFIDVITGENSRKNSLQTTHHLFNVTYSTIDTGLMVKSNPTLVARLLQSAFDCVQIGKLKRRIPPRIFSFSHISAAFQAVLEDHTNKFVLKASEDDIVPVIPHDAHPLILKSNATYLLVGGLGGLGRSLAHFLITHGAKHIAFISRSGAVSEAQQSFLSSLADQDINTRVYKCDISSAAELSVALRACAEEMPQILGAVQGAAVIKDAIFENMTYEDWVSATRPKIQGSWNLHNLLPRDLDFFVLLSSSAGVIGARGQANYAAGNAFQDALAHHRRHQNLKAISLDLGPVLGVGMVAEDEATLDILRKSGFIGVRERDFHLLVEAAMSGHTMDGHVTPPQVIVGTSTGGLILQNGVTDPYWHASPLFSIMRNVDLLPSVTSSASKIASIQELLTSSTSLIEATGVVTEGLATLLARSMNMQPADLDTGKPANAYGVDSLVAVGTRNWIFRETGVDVSVFEILSEASVCQLAERITRHCKFVGVELKGEAPEE